MLIAKIEDGQVVDVADYTAMFSGTSFPPSGPTDEFMVENSCMYVNTYLPYDPATQVLESCPPYIDIPDETNPLQWVYTVQVREMTPEEQEQYRHNLAIQIGQQASEALYKTDWTTIPSVADPEQSNPYLGNQAEFIAWRSQVRAIAVKPEYNSVIPTKPDELWITQDTAL
jgi:hypothetical protein